MLYDSEMEILNECFSLNPQNVLILSDDEGSEIYKSAINVYESFCKSSFWIDNSKNTNVPPDIINSDLMTYFEVMRFDDHSNNGKENPNRARASKMQEELFKNIPWAKDKKVFINSVTDLPTDKDHSYKMYLDGFSRTVNKHLNKLDKYDLNFQGYKKGFLIFDESSGLYYELYDKLRKEVLYTEMSHLARPHKYFLDRAFVDVFIDSDLDYLIWYAPYKVDSNNLSIEMPKVVFYDIKHFRNKKSLLVDYREPYMISSEI